MTKFIDICEAVWADNDALEDAKITLQAIKKADPETYDEMIDACIALIDAALSKHITAMVEDAIEGEREACIDLVLGLHAAQMGNHNYYHYAANAIRELRVTI